jgi:hypothetical protein
VSAPFGIVFFYRRKYTIAAFSRQTKVSIKRRRITEVRRGWARTR